MSRGSKGGDKLRSTRADISMRIGPESRKKDAAFKKANKKLQKNLPLLHKIHSEIQDHVKALRGERNAKLQAEAM